MLSGTMPRFGLSTMKLKNVSISKSAAKDLVERIDIVRLRLLKIEWMNLHRKELHENWNRAINRDPLERISPLE
jgi:hypothetical protein